MHVVQMQLAMNAMRGLRDHLLEQAHEATEQRDIDYFSGRAHGLDQAMNILHDKTDGAISAE